MSSYAASPSFSAIIDLIKHDNQHLVPPLCSFLRFTSSNSMNTNVKLNSGNSGKFLNPEENGSSLKERVSPVGSGDPLLPLSPSGGR